MRYSTTTPEARGRSSRAAAVALAALVALSAAGCGNDNNSTGPPVSLGTYALVSVNGAPLPFTVPNTGSNTIVVQSATLALTEVGTYSATVQGTTNGQSTSVLSDEGNFTQSGNVVTFHSTRLTAVAYTGVSSGNTLTITLPAAIVGATSGTLELEFEQ